jgi:hypothetical protein
VHAQPPPPPQPTNPGDPYSGVTVQFSASSYSINEGGGSATITVTLSAAATQQVTVHYATMGGTATPGNDFTPTSGTLTFSPANGETSKTFQISILNDLVPEQVEVFSVQLSQPMNATLGTPSTAGILIVDDDAWPTIRLIAHRTGSNFGTAVSDQVKEEGDPKKYVVLTNNDYDQVLPNGVRDYDDLAAGSGDDDLATINLKRMNPALPSGILKIEISGSVRVFKADGTVLSPTEWQVNLANPAGYLGGLVSGDVDIRLEALEPDPDCVVAYIYCDAGGQERSRDEVHLLLAEYRLASSDGQSVFPLVPSETLRYHSGLIEMPSSDPGKPGWNKVGSINPQSLYKIEVTGLPTSAVTGVEVRSDSGSDSFSDDWVAGASYVSTCDACVYEGTDWQTLLRTSETATIKASLGLHVVQGNSATVTLNTLLDKFTRKIDTLRIVPQPTQEPVGGRILVTYSPTTTVSFSAGVTQASGASTWTIVTQPDGAMPSPSGGSGTSFSFTTDKEGYYEVTLTHTFAGVSTTTKILAQVFLPGEPNPDLTNE